jgi:hypothetical protein
MSHVDDGTLHAYLDGELTPIERERMEGHLTGCAACRALLVEERALIERAGRLLGLAAPPERAAPPLQSLRRRRGSGFLIPLAWAAVVTLAIGVGWYARGVFVTPRAVSETGEARRATETPAVSAPTTPSDEPAQDQLAAAPVPSSAPAGRAEPRRDQPPQPGPVVAGAAGVRGLADREESAQRSPTAAAPPQAAKSLQARETAAPSASGAVVEISSDVKDVQRLRASAAWPIISATQARDLVGEDPGVIPGYAVSALRSNPADSSEIVVQQPIGDGMVWLFQRRSDAAAREMRRAQNYISNERLARYVRSLRIEIAGTLPADSLSLLLELIK